MRKKRAWCWSLAALALAACKPHPASSPAPRPAAIAAGEIGSTLPDFAVKDFQGHDLSSADLRGKVALVDFWATWCQPCKQEMPGYQKLADRYGPRGFIVVGFSLNMMTDTEDPIHFARRFGIIYPLAVADERVTKKFGGIQGLPTTLLYDRKGILRQKVIGFEYTNVIESKIKSLL